MRVIFHCKIPNSFHSIVSLTVCPVLKCAVCCLIPLISLSYPLNGKIQIIFIVTFCVN